MPGPQQALTVEHVAPDSLVLDPGNARQIAEPVVARREDRVIIGGHQRVTAALRAGLETIPVVWLDISRDRARTLGLALNKITGTWDTTLIACERTGRRGAAIELDAVYIEVTIARWERFAGETAERIDDQTSEELGRWLGWRLVSRRCAGQTGGGDPCGAWAMHDGRYCYLHDPAHADEAAEARKLGGLRRRREGTLNAAFELGDIDTIEGQRRLLEIVVADALALDNGAPKLRILIAAIHTAMKLRETSDLELRLRRLERAQAPRPERPPRSGAATSLLDEPGP